MPWLGARVRVRVRIRVRVRVRARARVSNLALLDVVGEPEQEGAVVLALGGGVAAQPLEPDVRDGVAITLLLEEVRVRVRVRVR